MVPQFTHWASPTLIVLTLSLVTSIYIQAAPDTLTHRSEEIRVTAIRSEEDLLEIPLAITVVNPLLFKANRNVGLDEMLSLVPGVIAQSRSANTDVRIQIRGFGARGAGERSNAGTSRGLRFYQDGIPETEPDGRTSFDLLDLGHASRIEVIRSNASTLWGNASGGVVSISTVPVENVPSLQLTTAAGSFGLARQSVLANAPLSDGQVYASFHVTSNDGWREHSNSDQLQGNVGILGKLGEHTSLRMFAVAAHNELRIPGALTRDQYDSRPQQAQNDTLIYKPTYVGRDERRFNRLGRLGMVFDHEFSSAHGISATAFMQSKYLQRSERNTFRDFTRYHVGGNMLYRFTEVLSPSVATKAMIGIDEQLQDGAILFSTLDPATKGRGNQLLANKREGANNLGAFLQNEWLIGDASFTGGLRYDRITYSYEEYTGRRLAEDRTFEALTPKLGATWRVLPNMSIYGNLGGGVEVPAGNETDPPSATGEDTIHLVNPLLQPIRSTTFEVGIKGYVSSGMDFVRSILYDAAVYVIDVRNDVIPYRNGRFYQTAGRSTRIGFEIGGSVTTVNDITLFASVSAMRSTYDDYVIDSGFVDPSKAGRTTSFNGNAIAGIPSLSVALRLRHDNMIAAGLFAEIDLRHVGMYYADDANALSVDASTVMDVAIGYRAMIASTIELTTSFRLANFLDQRFIASAWINPDRTSGGTPYIEPGMPRSANASIGLRFVL